MSLSANTFRLKAGLHALRENYFLPAGNIAPLSVTSPAEPRSSPAAATRGAAFIEQIALTKLGEEYEYE
jgi:hypothetical protein